MRLLAAALLLAATALAKTKEEMDAEMEVMHAFWCDVPWHADTDLCKEVAVRRDALAAGARRRAGFFVEGRADSVETRPRESARRSFESSS